MEPTAAVLALELPEIPAKNMDDVMETTGSPPRRRPTIAMARARDPASIHQLARENESGTAISAQESRAAKALCAMTSRGICPFTSKAAAPLKPMPKADRHAQSEQEDEADENDGNHRRVAPAAGLSRRRCSTKSEAATVVIKSPLVGTAR